MAVYHDPVAGLSGGVIDGAKMSALGMWHALPISNWPIVYYEAIGLFLIIFCEAWYWWHFET